MKSRWTLTLFAVVATVHLAVPAGMIVKREITLRHGRAYLFRTKPVDPYDAFRGRYVWLGFEQDHGPWHADQQTVHKNKAYAVLEVAPDGFAVVREVKPQPPVTGEYLEVRVNRWGWGTDSGTVYFTMPFDRYYMEETKAPAAERAYWERNRRGQTNQNTYAVVRIRNGESVLENLYVDGQPIAEFVRTH